MILTSTYQHTQNTHKANVEYKLPANITDYAMLNVGHVQVSECVEFECLDPDTENPENQETYGMWLCYR